MRLVQGHLCHGKQLSWCSHPRATHHKQELDQVRRTAAAPAHGAILQQPVYQFGVHSSHQPLTSWLEAPLRAMMGTAITTLTRHVGAAAAY
jgi:hypothetical protein